MNSITTIGNEAYQVVSVILDDGSVAVLSFMYKPAIKRWVFSVQHELLTVYNLSLCVHPNLLRTWRGTLNFGFACTSADGSDPVESDDFSSGRCQFYSLNSADVIRVESEVIGEFI